MLLASVPAHADLPAREFIELCKAIPTVLAPGAEASSLSKMAAVGCSQYVRGYADGQGMLKEFGFGKTPYCLPSSTSAEQLVKVVLKRAETHPVELNFPSSFFVFSALIDAFPCKK